MNALMILAMIPDPVLKKLCSELHVIVDALEKRNVHDISEGGARIVQFIVEQAEAHGYNEEKILELLEKYAPADIPIEFLGDLIKRRGPSHAN